MELLACPVETALLRIGDPGKALVPGSGHGGTGPAVPQCLRGGWPAPRPAAC